MTVQQEEQRERQRLRNLKRGGVMNDLDLSLGQKEHLIGMGDYELGLDFYVQPTTPRKVHKATAKALGKRGLIEAAHLGLGFRLTRLGWRVYARLAADRLAAEGRRYTERVKGAEGAGRFKV